ncbi:DNA-binding MarR family transcriptional regulator [Enterococcus sp. UD-01]|jgi:DNA-binding MarR family transcriptional regulator
MSKVRDESMNTKQIDQWLAFSQKQMYVEKKLEELMRKESDILLSEYYALYQLNQHDGKMRMNDLGKYLYLSQSALSRLINRLESKDPQYLIKVNCSEDKRGIYVKLTEAGIAEVEKINTLIEKALETYFNEA